MARIISRERAVRIASQWHSVMTWSDPGVTMYALSSTERVQSEKHRSDLQAYIADCLKGCRTKTDKRELNSLARYIALVKLEPNQTTFGDAVKAYQTAARL